MTIPRYRTFPQPKEFIGVCFVDSSFVDVNVQRLRKTSTPYVVVIVDESILRYQATFLVYLRFSLSMEEFGYEKLDVYQCSMTLLGQVYVLLDKLPKGYAHLGDQLRRSTLSIPLNIAEGSGKSSPAERMRFYEIARASALECSAIINCCMTLKIAGQDSLSTSRSLVFRIVQMLSKLAPNYR